MLVKKTSCALIAASSVEAVPELSRRGVMGGLLSASCVGAAAAHSIGHKDTHHAAKSAMAAPYVKRGIQPPPPLIMLDPGHGGKDPGAIGVSGTYEKHISEAAAKTLHDALVATGRYRVVMTRADDRFIPLDGRVELAQKHQASLFVSMHADALHDPEVRGASVYTLSSGASDAQTEALARKENSADRFAGPAFHGVSPEIQQILSSLVSEETRRGSAHMAASVVESFQSRIGLLTHPSRHAAFVVLKAADIPSVLVEMGFMSNRMDEAALRQQSHRAQVASAMKVAIERYFASRPTLMEG